MKRLPIIAVLIAATLATYWPVIHHDFIGIDDPVMVSRNPDLNPPFAAGVAKYWKTSVRALYMPLTYTAWAATAALPRDGDVLPPQRFHTLSLAVHVLAVLAAFTLLRELVENNLAAAGGALLFAIHPLQVESIAWIALLKDLLAGLFTLVAVWQYFRFVKTSEDESRRARAWLHYFIAIVAFALGMLAKPSAVIAPLIAATIDIGLLRRPVGDVAKSLWPWAVLALPFVLIAQGAQHGSFLPILGTPRELPLWWRPIVACDAIAFYLGKLVFPCKLAIDYGRSPWDVMSHGWVWLTMLVPIVLIVIFWVRGLHGILTGFAIVIASLLPVLGLVPFDFQEKSNVTDHYMYLPMLGPALAIAWLLWRYPRRITYAITLLILLIFATRSRLQTAHWQDSETCYRHGLAVNPKSWWLTDGLGWHLLEKERPTEAIPYLQRAADLAPGYAAVHAHLGAAYAETGNVHGAVSHLEKSLAIDPIQPRTRVLLADIQLLRGLNDDAMKHYKIAAEQAPDDPVIAERLKRVQNAD